MFGTRKSEDRGSADHGWLRSRHTFSFSHYQDPQWVGFRALRVINDDHVAPGKGFGTHPHRDMEIISYVLEGALEHRDSMGTGSIIRPGEVQRMSAGTGVTHSEYNHSKSEEVHFLQIWIVPETRGIEPGYEQKDFPAQDKQDRLRLVASRDGRDGSVTIHQDANLYATLITPGATVTYERPDGRHVWLHVARGSVSVGEHSLRAGDAVYTGDEPIIRMSGDEPAEVLLFDLA
jgi:redox-sensitive bicupin YhaK (pirin superfamily)